MYNAGTTGWLANRVSTDNARAQALPAMPTDAAQELIFAGVRRLSAVPSWAILAMIIMATTAVCATVIIRSRGEFHDSAQQLSRLASETDTLRQENAALQLQIQRLTNDSGTIELAARERLGMVRPGDIVLPIESITASNLGKVSFVR